MGLMDSIAGAATPDQAPAPVQDNGRSAFDFFVGQGLAPHQAAGIVGNLQGESGQGLNPNAVNRGDGRDGSDSIGIGQWNGTRAQALKDYAASKGASWNDLNTQLEFLHSELKGPEAKAYAGLTAAKTPEEAGQAMLAYERPKDWSKPGAHPERGQYAAKVFASYGGQPAQASPAAPAVGFPQQPGPVFAANESAGAQRYPNGFRTMGVGDYMMPQIGGSPDYAPRAAPPIFAPPQQAPKQQPQSESQPAGFDIPQMQAPPIFAAPRPRVDLTKLRAAFKAPTFSRG